MFRPTCPKSGNNFSSSAPIIELQLQRENLNMQFLLPNSAEVQQLALTLYTALLQSGLNSVYFQCKLNCLCTYLYVWAAKTWYFKIGYMNQCPSRELEEITLNMQSLLRY